MALKTWVPVTETGAQVTEISGVTLGAVLRRVQLFVSAFSFAVLGWLGIAMSSGNPNTTPRFSFIPDVSVETAVAGTMTLDHYVRSPLESTGNDTPIVLGADENQLSSLDQLRVRQKDDIAATQVSRLSPDQSDRDPPGL